MKFCVYAICKNESKFVEKWLESMSEADYICVLDTGSEDDTYELFKKAKEKSEYKNKLIINQRIITPWRFDDARNLSMTFIPKDVDFCVSTDLDELFTPGWREYYQSIIEKELKKGKQVDRLKYRFGVTKIQAPYYDRIHRNNGLYAWKYPVHEQLTYLGSEENVIYTDENDKVYISHHEDISKCRDFYADLTEKRIKENPDDERSYLFLVDEYYRAKRYEKCIDFIENQIKKDVLQYNNEILSFLLLTLGKCYEELGNTDAALKCYNKGIEVDCSFRDNYLKIATLFISFKKWEEAIAIVYEAFKKTSRKYNQFEIETGWTSYPYEVLSLCYYQIGRVQLAKDYATVALSYDPDNKLLQNNYFYYCSKLVC